jgi:16S rRNA A1518/A1519 N6-dimethyltransferase RsmA/KsgA/DIM1 with predicted DNA glycosylase/AP lyase activity
MNSIIPYFETTRYRVRAIIELAKIKQDELAVDLGSGDGRIVAALAEGGAIVRGYELNPSLIEKSNLLLAQKNLSTKVSILQKNFWQEELSQFRIITIYPMPDILEELERKFESELKPGTRVLTNYYPLPTWTPITKKDNIYLYIK